MVKRLSGDTLIILGAAVLFTGIASANKTDPLTVTPTSTNTSLNKTYTAHATMNKKTAVMVKYLLRNPHLTVMAVAGKSLKTHATQRDIIVNYTITGTTDRKTALKLKKLFQNYKHISINTQMALQPQPLNNAYTTFYPGFTPFYYKGVPPVYAKGNVVWYPVRIHGNSIADYQLESLKAPFPMGYATSIASHIPYLP